MPAIGYLSLITIGTAITGVILVLAVLLTNPTAIGPTGVTVWFVDMYAAVAGLITLVLYVAKSYLHLHATNLIRLKYSWRQGLLISGWVTLVLALSSLGQLATKDAILIAALLVLFEIYIRLRQS